MSSIEQINYVLRGDNGYIQLQFLGENRYRYRFVPLNIDATEFKTEAAAKIFQGILERLGINCTVVPLDLEAIENNWKSFLMDESTSDSITP